MVTREMCKMCHKENPVGFTVPYSVWKEVVPESLIDSVVCITCFTSLGDKKMVKWDVDIKFYPVSLVTHFED